MKGCLRSCDADHCSPSSGYRHLLRRKCRRKKKIMKIREEGKVLEK
jgi:hypothetical protein